jgi:hypothetical protein
MSRREFANLKELQDFARRNRKLYALEETAKFAERQRRLLPLPVDPISKAMTRSLRSTGITQTAAPQP